MNQSLALMTAMLMAGNASAAITGFLVPPGGSSTGTLPAAVAYGFYLAPVAAPFDSHWFVTVDSDTPRLIFTVDNSYNPRTGSGALVFTQLSLSGSGLPGTVLTAAHPPCDPAAFSCVFRYVSDVAVTAGTYDLNLVGRNPRDGSYSLTVTAVPEPSTAAMAGLGVFLMSALFRGRR